MRTLIVGVTVVALLPLLALITAVALEFWPSEWNSQQQAVLAAALIGACAPLYAAGAKALYDEVAARQAHNRQIRQILFSGYEDYSRALLYPLLATAGDLYAALKWEVENANEETKTEVVYRVCRYVESVQRLRIRYTPGAQTPQRGLFLASIEAEEAVWCLLVEPWALGVPGAIGEAVAAEAVRDTQGNLLPITSFGKNCTMEDIRYLTENILLALTSHETRKLLADTLFALNAVLDWGIMGVLKPWYGRSPAFPTDALKPILAVPQELRDKNGIQIPDISHLKAGLVGRR
jgi:hypothetical protein